MIPALSPPLYRTQGSIGLVLKSLEKRLENVSTKQTVTNQQDQGTLTQERQRSAGLKWLSY